MRTENVSYYMQLQHSQSCQWQRSMARLVIPPLRIARVRQRIPSCPFHSSIHYKKKKGKKKVGHLVLVSTYIINARKQTLY